MAELFNPYWSARPPECCYCPEIGIAEEVPDVSVVTSISVGHGSLAFMTNTEAAFRTIQRTRQRKAEGLQPQVYAEMGNGPWAVPWEK